MKFEQNLSAFNLFLSSMALFALGFAMTFQTEFFLAWFPYASGILLIYTSLSKFFSYFHRENKNEWVLLGDTAMLIQGILCFIIPDMALIIFPAFVVFYSVCITIISFVVYSQFKKSHTPFAFLMLLKGLVFAIIAITVLIANLKLSAYYVSKFTGVYLFFYGLAIFGDFRNEDASKSHSNKINRKLSLRLPVLFTANVLSKTLNMVNDFFKNLGEDGEEHKEINLSHNNNTTPIDLDVLIHVKKGGVGPFGHVDFYYHGYVLSYGNYDAESIKGMGAMGEGVLFFVNSKKDYIRFCNENTEKTIFDYGIVLSNEQKENMHKKIKEHMANSYTWLAPVDRFCNKDKDPELFDDYASILSKHTKVLFRKFKTGKFKYYFTMYSNCVKFADSILGETGIDILQLNGIITPGAYFNYFDKEYRKSGTNVIKKVVYNPKGKIK